MEEEEEEEEDIKEPSSEQLQNTNMTMNNNKSPGTDNTHAKLFKKGGYDLYKYRHE